MRKDKDSSLFGEIKFYKPQGGYGFIRHDDITKDIHFGREGVSPKVDHNTIKTGAQIKFKLRESRKGLEAFDIIPLHKPFKFIIDFEKEEVEDGTFVKGISINNTTIWLSVNDGAVFATASNPHQEDSEEDEDFDEPEPWADDAN